MLGLPGIDAFIAATGLFRKMSVVTRNIDDMRIPGLTIFNPWDLKNR